jgi:hypothetical protein
VQHDALPELVADQVTQRGQPSEVRPVLLEVATLLCSCEAMDAR